MNPTDFFFIYILKELFDCAPNTEKVITSIYRALDMLDEPAFVYGNPSIFVPPISIPIIKGHLLFGREVVSYIRYHEKRVECEVVMK